MKKLLLMFAAVATLFTACNKDHNDGGKHDHSADIVGTWSILTANYAEVLIINADGSAVSYGVEDGEYWENVKGTIVVDGDNITMTFEDNDNLTGHFDIIPNHSFSLFEDSGERYVYNYCANDLADKIIGMWVSTDAPTENGDIMTVQTYIENGKAIYTGFGSYTDSYLVNDEATYKVIGDLLFYLLPQDKVSEGISPYIIKRLTYVPDGNAYGDIMIQKSKKMVDGKEVEATSSMLRIKQGLELVNQSYDYNNVYVSNVKGQDKDIPFLNTSFNFAKMDGSIIDKFLKSTLFAVEFPNANTLKYSFLVNGQTTPMTAPIEVEGNKMTIKMSANGAAYHDVELYVFQDKDNSQMHLYMPTASFEKFFANTSVYVMLGNGQLKENDTEAIAGVYNTIADAVHSINLSLVMSKSK